MSVRSHRTRAHLTVLGSILVLLTLAGCGRGPDTCLCGGPNIPAWYLNTPEDPDFVYVTASASSQKMMGVIKKATENARKDFAADLDTTLAQNTRAFTDSLSDALTQQFTDARKAAADTLAAESTPKEKEVFQKDNGTWRAFVLMEGSRGKAMRALVTELEDNEELLAKFRSSQVYNKLSEASETRNRNSTDRSQDG